MRSRSTAPLLSGRLMTVEQIDALIAEVERKFDNVKEQAQTECLRLQGEHRALTKLRERIQATDEHSPTGQKGTTVP